MAGAGTNESECDPNDYADDARGFAIWALVLPCLAATICLYQLGLMIPYARSHKLSFTVLLLDALAVVVRIGCGSLYFSDFESLFRNYYGKQHQRVAAWTHVGMTACRSIAGPFTCGMSAYRICSRTPQVLWVVASLFCVLLVSSRPEPEEIYLQQSATPNRTRHQPASTLEASWSLVMCVVEVRFHVKRTDEFRVCVLCACDAVGRAAVDASFLSRWTDSGQIKSKRIPQYVVVSVVLVAAGFMVLIQGVLIAFSPPEPNKTDRFPRTAADLVANVVMASYGIFFGSLAAVGGYRLRKRLRDAYSSSSILWRIQRVIVLLSCLTFSCVLAVGINLFYNDTVQKRIGFWFYICFAEMSVAVVISFAVPVLDTAKEGKEVHEDDSRGARAVAQASSSSFGGKRGRANKSADDHYNNELVPFWGPPV